MFELNPGIPKPPHTLNMSISGRRVDFLWMFYETGKLENVGR